jgi:hypothetical protein
MRPSTPEEREEFKRFRRSKGQLKGERGRPPVKRTKLLEEALRKASALLSHAMNYYNKINGFKPWAEGEEAIAEFKILLDGGAANGSTLVACGQTAEKADEIQGAN